MRELVQLRRFPPVPWKNPVLAVIIPAGGSRCCLGSFFRAQTGPGAFSSLRSSLSLLGKSRSLPPAPAPPSLFLPGKVSPSPGVRAGIWADPEDPSFRLFPTQAGMRMSVSLAPTWNSRNLDLELQGIS